MRALAGLILAAVLLAVAFPAPASADGSGTALPARADVGPMRHIWQTWNNCGPAAVVMALSTLGITGDQEVARLALRGPDIRRGMGPGPVDPWVQELYGLRSVSRMNGTVEMMKSLVANGFAPMVTQWMQDPSVSRIAHWRTVRGYDDAQGAFFVNDPMLGNNVALSYEWFNDNWQAFSYRWMVIYDPKDEQRLQQVIGRDWVESDMRDAFYARAKADAQTQNTSAAWLTYGEAAYQDGWFYEAVQAFERGMSMGSANGVFTVRGSYPAALRAIGRLGDADQSAARLATTASTPATVITSPDSFARILAARRSWTADVIHPDAGLTF